MIGTRLFNHAYGGTLALLIYTSIAVLCIISRSTGLEDIVVNSALALIFLPIAMLLYAIEKLQWKNGKRFFPPRMDEQIILTKPLLKAERRHSIFMALLVIIFCTAPYMSQMLNEQTLSFPGLTEASPIITWGYTLHIFGFARVRMALSTMSNKTKVVDQDQLDRLATALIIKHNNLAPGAEYSVMFSVTFTRLLPEVKMHITSNAPNDPVIELDDFKNAVVMTAVTQTANPYDLPSFASQRSTITIEELSAHQKIEAMAEYAAAEKILTEQIITN